jgi:hypothetical protein
MSQKLSFIVVDSGDPSVGISPIFEEVTIVLENGGWDSELLQDFQESMREVLKSHLTEVRGKVFTLDEYNESYEG